MTEGADTCVLQMGARLHYAAPAALARKGRLAALVTDATEAVVGGLTEQIARQIAPKAIARLKGRRVPQSIPRDRVHSSVFPFLQMAAAERLGPKIAKSARTLHRCGVGGHQLSKVAIKNDFFGAKTIYVHPCATTDAVIEAKKRGLTVVLEAISHPHNKKVELEEFARYGMPADQTDALVEDNIAFFKDEAQYADIILAASPYVRDGLVALGLSKERIRIVRYGLDASFAEGMVPTPKVGQVLYVGAINYLKGIPILAAATKILDSQHVGIAVDAVGPLAPGMAGRPEIEGPRYLGQVPRALVRDHFASADVFAFPTLSDGFGLVLLEAMAAGLPVVCTESCADLVEDGVNGLLVPTRDPKALASAIAQIVGDRALRDRMSLAAKQTAVRHTLDTYAETLVAAVTDAIPKVNETFRIAAPP